MRISSYLNLTVDWFIFSLFFYFGWRFIIKGLKPALFLAEVLLKNGRLCAPSFNPEKFASIKFTSIFFFLFFLLPKLWVFNQSGLLLLKVVYAFIKILLLLDVLHFMVEFDFCLLNQTDHFLKSLRLFGRSVSEVAWEFVLTASVLFTFKLQLILSCLRYDRILKWSIFRDGNQGFSGRGAVR